MGKCPAAEKGKQQILGDLETLPGGWRLKPALLRLMRERKKLEVLRSCTIRGQRNRWWKAACCQAEALGNQERGLKVLLLPGLRRNRQSCLAGRASRGWRHGRVPSGQAGNCTKGA